VPLIGQSIPEGLRRPVIGQSPPGLEGGEGEGRGERIIIQRRLVDRRLKANGKSRNGASGAGGEGRGGEGRGGESAEQ